MRQLNIVAYVFAGVSWSMLGIAGIGLWKSSTILVKRTEFLFLVLTAIVISFALTALFLVVILAARGITGSDHVDGKEPDA